MKTANAKRPTDRKQDKTKTTETATPCPSTPEAEPLPTVCPDCGDDFKLWVEKGLQVVRCAGCGAACVERRTPQGHKRIHSIATPDEVRADTARGAFMQRKAWKAARADIDKAMFSRLPESVSDLARAAVADYPSGLAGLGFAFRDAREIPAVKEAASALDGLFTRATAALSQSEADPGAIEAGARALRETFTPDPDGDGARYGHAYPFTPWPECWTGADWKRLPETTRGDLLRFRDALARLNATPKAGGTAAKTEPEPDAGKLAAKRKERPIQKHLRDPDEMLIFKVMDACPKLDARTRNNTVKHWDVFLPAWRNNESDYTIAEKLKRPRKTIERRRKTIEAEVLDGFPIAGLKYDLSVFKAAMREQERARETGFTAYKGALLGSMNPNED
jgi:Zn ribbon nucleic-acid-binding protein